MKWFLPSNENTSRAQCLRRYRRLWISCIVPYGHLIQLMSACICMGVWEEGGKGVCMCEREQGKKEN